LGNLLTVGSGHRSPATPSRYRIPPVGMVRGFAGPDRVRGRPRPGATVRRTAAVPKTDKAHDVVAADPTLPARWASACSADAFLNPATPLPGRRARCGAPRSLGIAHAAPGVQVYLPAATHRGRILAPPRSRRRDRLTPR